MWPRTSYFHGWQRSCEPAMMETAAAALHHRSISAAAALSSSIE
jgi:hypothetical protein